MSPRNRSQNEQVRTVSTGKILDAAFKVMSDKGYDAASIADIAREAKISKGLMYNYFESKEDLLKALINRTLGNSDILLEEIHSDNPATTLSNIFSWFFHELKYNIGEWRFLTGIMLKSEKFDFIKPLINQKINEYTQLFTMMLTQMGVENAEGEARIIGCIFDGIGIQYLVMGIEYPLDQLEQYLKNKYCTKQP